MASTQTALPEFSPAITAKLRALQQKLGAHDLESTLDKSLNIATFIADTVHSPERKLLLEADGEFMELKSIL